MKETIYSKYIKRLIDFCLGLIGLIVLGIPMLILAVLVKTKLGSPILFKQERPGKNEQLFNMYKFRTMTDEIDESGELLPDDIRLTKFGKFLRSTSLDELPELVNIVKGDMAIVGPRPLLVKYLPRYSDEQKKRHLVRPGLTGLAQVNGRNALSWEDKFKYDIKYTEKISFSLDVKIFFLTIGKVFKREGISSDTSKTMEEFMGE